MHYFPVNYSSLIPQNLLQWVIENYEVDAQATITYIKRGFNDTYLITEPSQKKYILRVYNFDWRSLRGIKSEIVILAMIYENNRRNVAQPISAKKNGFVQSIDAPEGQRRVVLFRFAEGKVVRKLSYEQAFLLGEEIGKIHIKTEMFNYCTLDQNYAIGFQFKKTLRVLNPILVNHREQYEYLEQLAEDFYDTFTDEAKTELAHGICHGDLQAENVHFTDNNELTIFDFDFMGHGYQVYDIGVFIWYDHKNKTKEIVDSFIKGYETQRKLSETELKLLPYFSTLRAIFQMTLYCELNDGQNLPQWNPQQVADFVKKIKRWHETESVKFRK